MRPTLVWGLILVGVLRVPLFHDFEIQPAIESGVKGEEVEFKSPLPQRTAPTPPSTPRPSTTPTNIPQFNNVVRPTNAPEISPQPTPQLIEEIFLLITETELKDERLEIDFPVLDLNQDWFLVIEYDLISVEDTLGFDHPGFTIHIDDRLAYQQSVFENETKVIEFNPKVFSDHPQTLSIWSGNRGDELKDTYTIIKNIKLIPQDNHRFIETEPINDLVVTFDSEDFLTLEWSSPEITDLNLGRVLAYDIRYLSEPITSENWLQAQPVEVFSPHEFSPQFPKTKEIALVKDPLVKSGYLAIRSLDSTGELSPLGESVFY